MRDLLGGKGANLAEMTRVLGPELVPAGFTITTEACVAYMSAGGRSPEGLADVVGEALARLEERAGRRLGDPEDPLLLSVRSGARDSMPGMATRGPPRRPASRSRATRSPGRRRPAATSWSTLRARTSYPEYAPRVTFMSWPAGCPRWTPS